MSADLEWLFATLEQNTAVKIAAVVFVYALLAAFLVRSEAGKRVLRSFRFLFYSEPGVDASIATRRRILELEERVELLKRSFSDKSLQARREAIQSELENQLSRDLPDLVKRKLAQLQAADRSLDSTIRTAINDAVAVYLTAHKPADLLADRKEQARFTERIDRGRILENTIEEQMRSAGRLKAVMINLFVLFNIGVLLVYLFAASNLTDRAVTAIIGLYISLAAFIVYIYRTSNFRSSVLLALREDAKKYFDAEDYIGRLKPGASPTDRDVEVLKLLLINRAEREKMADHPYELVLKGVTNSNIQFKGGKIIPSSKADK